MLLYNGQKTIDKKEYSVRGKAKECVLISPNKTKLKAFEEKYTIQIKTEIIELAKSSASVLLTATVDRDFENKPIKLNTELNVGKFIEPKI